MGLRFSSPIQCLLSSRIFCPVHLHHGQCQVRLRHHQVAPVRCSFQQVKNRLKFLRSLCKVSLPLQGLSHKIPRVQAVLVPLAQHPTPNLPGLACFSECLLIQTQIEIGFRHRITQGRRDHRVLRKLFVDRLKRRAQELLVQQDTGDIRCIHKGAHQFKSSCRLILLLFRQFALS